MSFTGQFNFGNPITRKNILTSVDDTAIIPVGLQTTNVGNTFGIKVSDLIPVSVIAVNGTSLYSTTPLAGPFVTTQHNTLLGANAGSNTNTEGLICIGNGAGAQTVPGGSPNYSTFLGYNAGTNATNAINSFFAGQSAGSNAPNAEYSVLIGSHAGHSSTGGNYSNCLGSDAGRQADGVYNSNFLGKSAGTRAYFSHNSNFFGASAGFQAVNSHNSNFFGEEAGMNSSANNVNAFGKAAHKAGTLDGQTVFANATLPSYLNRTVALAAITVPLGAVAGNTYLYYNETIFAIQGIRL